MGTNDFSLFSTDNSKITHLYDLLLLFRYTENSAAKSRSKPKKKRVLTTASSWVSVRKWHLQPQLSGNPHLPLWLHCWPLRGCLLMRKRAHTPTHPPRACSGAGTPRCTNASTKGIHFQLFLTSGCSQLFISFARLMRWLLSSSPPHLSWKIMLQLGCRCRNYTHLSRKSLQSRVRLT